MGKVKYKVNDSFLDKIDNQDKAYLLGLWYADGTVYEKQHIIKIDLIDKELLEKVKNFLEYNGKIWKYEQGIKYFDGKGYECNDSYRLRINSKRLTKRLIDLGCVPNKTYILKFPTEEQLPNEFLKDFIRGYFDGDGGISYWIPNTKNNTNWKKFSINFCGTTDIINNISKILKEKFNCCPAISDRFPDRNNNNLQLSICGNRVVKNILEWLYKDAKTYMDRKYQKFLLLLEECNRVDNDNKLYGSAYQRRKIIRLFDLKVYDSMANARDDNRYKSSSAIFQRCKKKDNFMYLDDYNKEVK